MQWIPNCARSALVMGIFLASAHVTLGVEPAQPATRNSKFSVVGYLPTYSLKSFDASQGKSLTDLILFSAQPSAAGGLDSTDITPEALELARTVKSRFGTRICLAVGGWEKGKHFAPTATNPESRKKFIRLLSQYCIDHKLDGVDFDWEFPRGDQEVAGYSALLVETKAELQPRGMVVTVAVEPSQRLTADAYRAVDRVHIMSYFAADDRSSLDHAKWSVATFLSQGVPKEKIVMGLPFYGHTGSGNPRDLSYATIVEKFHPAPAQDQAGGYNFNGPVSIRAKTRYALEQKIGGVMIWELGQDTQDQTSLLRAIAAELAGK